MSASIRYTIHAITIGLLTLLTQTGGLIYGLSIVITHLTKRHTSFPPWTKSIFNAGVFLSLYVGINALFIPPLAKYVYNRVPLPVMGKEPIKPLRAFTWIMNRHYVSPELRNGAIEVSEALNKRFPSSILFYLDANFPFMDGFPLFPHLSHSDGKKLDLAFFYTDQRGAPLNNAPSWMGYGVYAPPLPGEVDKPEACRKKGYWQYSLLEFFVPGLQGDGFVLDPIRTRYLALAFAEEKGIGKVFIEPHLKTRLSLDHAKIRFHGCQAVRHDDHLHVQLK